MKKRVATSVLVLNRFYKTYFYFLSFVYIYFTFNFITQYLFRFFFLYMHSSIFHPKQSCVRPKICLKNEIIVKRVLKKTLDYEPYFLQMFSYDIVKGTFLMQSFIHRVASHMYLFKSYQKYIFQVKFFSHLFPDYNNIFVNFAWTIILLRKRHGHRC